MEDRTSGPKEEGKQIIHPKPTGRHSSARPLPEKVPYPFSSPGLLCLGKSDYAAIEPFRRESFFAQALGLWKDNPWRFVWQRLYHRFTQPVSAGTGCSP